MARDGVSALRAFPSFSFSIHELFHTVLFDVVLVLYHAHMVPCPVAFIDGLQPVAREIGALIAICYFLCFEQIAALFEVGALFIPYAATAAVGDSDSLAFHIEL